MDSWGNYPKVKNQTASLVKNFSLESVEKSDNKKFLAVGLKRSYGDSCVNDEGVLLQNSKNNNLLSFDNNAGILKAESGFTIAEIIDVFLPKGWFPPVVPGTKFVTLAGAVANDIHGKNHHVSGTFGNHVISFALKRSNGEVKICSKKENVELFNATISGLGLTGIILWVELQLKKVESSLIDLKSIKFNGLNEFFSLSKKHDENFEYTVAWLDCISSGNNFGRGIYMAGNHSKSGGAASSFAVKAGLIKSIPKPLRTVPFYFPSFVLNKYSIRAFNELYYNKQFSKEVTPQVQIDPFFFPLDAVYGWNKIYGKSGFFQFQCVVPSKNAEVFMEKMLKEAVDSGQASFLAVIKKFGSIKSTGMLSFPREGTTLCMDFANRGDKTIKLMRKLEELTFESDGAMYPAKDALMSSASFQKFFPNWSKFKEYIDPEFSSSFWRRVSGS